MAEVSVAYKKGNDNNNKNGVDTGDVELVGVKKRPAKEGESTENLTDSDDNRRRARTESLREFNRARAHSSFLVVAPKKEGQSSIVTIFSIWNTMMGTSMLALPWAIQQAGFATGISLMIIMSLLVFYTAYLTVTLTMAHSSSSPDQIIDFPDVCEAYLGKAAKTICIIANLIAFISVLIIFWVLMSGFLYNTGKFIHNLSSNEEVTNASFICPDPNEPGSVVRTTDASATAATATATAAATSAAPTNASNVDQPVDTFTKLWHEQNTCPFWLFLIIVPLINFKSAEIFTKFNVLGTVSVFYLFIFVTYHGIDWVQSGATADSYAHESIINYDNKWLKLCGIMSMAMFIHNSIMSILRTQKNPENNTRDLIIGYGLVTATYLFVGSLYFLTVPCNIFAQVFLEHLPDTDVTAVIARALLLVQLTCIFPLMIYILRITVMMVVFGDIWPSVIHVVVFNLVTLVICSMVACFYPKVGDLIRYASALFGLLLIWILPPLVYMFKLREKNALTRVQIAIHGGLMLLGTCISVSQFVL